MPLIEKEYYAIRIVSNINCGTIFQQKLKILDMNDFRTTLARHFSWYATIKQKIIESTTLT